MLKSYVITSIFFWRWMWVHIRSKITKVKYSSVSNCTNKSVVFPRAVLRPSDNCAGSTANSSRIIAIYCVAHNLNMYKILNLSEKWSDKIVRKNCN